MKKETTAVRLNEYMDTHNLKQVDILIKAKPFTEQYGIKLNKNDLSQYVSGKVEPGQDKVFILSKALGVDPAWIMGLDVVEAFSNSVMIPVYGSIPAGIPLEAIEDIQGQVDIPTDWLKGGKEYIALQVKGDSMYPKYLDGDLVIILVQSDCESYQDCACYVNGFNATLKTVVKGIDKIELKPYNPNYPPQTYQHPGEVVIIGVVKELRRKL